jgi:Uma2 family endonuclease
MTAILKSITAPQNIFYPESDGKPMGETDIHIRLIMEIMRTLSIHFSKQNDIYVLGDVLFYYQEGNPKKFVVPDVMVVKGVGKHLRRSYKLWEEGKVPSVVFEISSRSTWGEDLNSKWLIYQQLGVKEYYIFDPEYDYLPEPLVAYKLIKGELRKIQVRNNRIFSRELGLELVNTGETLRFFDVEQNEFLMDAQEEHEARLAEHQSYLAEKEARLKAERELAELKKLLRKRN